MTLVRTTVTVVLGVLAVRASAGDLAERAAASYAIDTSGSTTALPVGERGVIVIAIRPVPDVHVQTQAPLRAALSTSSGLALSRDRLGWPDAGPPGAGSPRFDVAFTATAPGPQTATARLEFFVCSAKWCVKQEREVAVHVAVLGGPAAARPEGGR